MPDDEIVAAFAPAAVGWRVVTLDPASRTVSSRPVAGWAIVNGDAVPLVGAAGARALEPLEADAPGLVGVYGPGAEPLSADYTAARRRVREARRAERDRRRLEADARAPEPQQEDVLPDDDPPDAA